MKRETMYLGIQQVAGEFDNAVKFTPPEGRVRVNAVSLPDARIRITVSDTGIGIKPEHLKQVFETFRQIPNLISRTQDGVELGLPLAKKLTERHDGQLELYSLPGHGTGAYITFPASRVTNLLFRNRLAPAQPALCPRAMSRYDRFATPG